MRLLDLFCGVGGCAKGYIGAGFEVCGVDIVPQPEYCGDAFRQGDALKWLRSKPMLIGVDAIHASPPCKHRTVARNGGRRQAHLFDPHPDLLSPVLELLAAEDRPWAVENVPNGPPLDAPYVVTLCGSMFGLPIRRHRLFASNIPLPQLECRHAEQGQVVGVYGNGGADANRSVRGGGGGVKVVRQEAANTLGIDWSTHQPSLAQAIPPAYTRWVGHHLIAAASGAPIANPPV